MKKQKLFLLSLSLLLLLLLSACGSKEIKVLDYGGTGENRYLAEQETPKNNDGIAAADVLDGTIYYVTKQSDSESAFQPPTVLASIEGETGKILTWQSLQNSLEGLAEAEDFKLDDISAVSVQPDGSAVLVMEAQRGGSEYEDLDALMEAIESGTDQEEKIEWFCEVVALDADHGVRWSCQLPDKFLYGNTMEILCDSSGYTYVMDGSSEGSYEQLLVLDSSGNQVYYEQNRYQHMALGQDNAVLLLRLSMDKTQWEVVQPDPESWKMELLCTLPLLQDGEATQSRFYAGNDWFDLYCVTEMSLYGIDLGKDGKACAVTQILSWMNYGIEGTTIQSFCPGKGKNFTVLSYSTDFGAELTRMQWQSKSIEDSRTKLTLACRQLPSTLSQAILRFNRENEEYKLLVRDYGSAQTTGIDRLTVDLNAGNLPDIFYLEDIDQQILINKGYLEDLWPYIDSDSELSRETLVEPLFDAMSIDGKLYTFTNGFNIETTVALKAVVGEESGWSLSRFRELAEETPELEYLGVLWCTQDSVLEQVIDLYAQQFVDWEAGEATFDSPEFIELMEYVAMYPQSQNSYTKEELYGLAEGKILYWKVTHSGIEVYDWKTTTYISVSDKTAVVHKGYPGLPGNGSVFQPELQLAMTATGEHKDVVWSFLRTLVLEENLDVTDYGPSKTYNCFPANRELLEQMIQQYNDKQSQMIQGEPWSQEDIDAFYDLINGITVVVRPQEQLEGIIRDEISRFLSGQQDAQTAAKAIQNRVQLCLDEQK